MDPLSGLLGALTALVTASSVMFARLTWERRKGNAEAREADARGVSELSDAAAVAAQTATALLQEFKAQANAQMAWRDKRIADLESHVEGLESRLAELERENAVLRRERKGE